MQTFSLILDNLLTAPILFFILGLSAGLLKSDLEIPRSISRYLSIYLMMAIGFKGGVALANAPTGSTFLMSAAIAGVGFSLAWPFVANFIVINFTKVDKVTAAAIAAHYGSVSLVTFATAASFLSTLSVPYQESLAAVLALMEAPALLTGIYLAQKAMNEEKGGAISTNIVQHIVTNSAVLLILGSFLIGYITGPAGLEKVKGFFVDPFQGILCLFLLDLGLMVAREREHLKAFNLSLISVGIVIPLLGAGVGIGLATLMGMDQGSALLFTILCASASYIAVPAAMRSVLPQAKAGIYVPLTLAITFPFNIIFGIPLYFELIKIISTL